MRRDNKGLDFTGATSVNENGRLVYGKSGTKTKVKVPRVNYSDEDRQIIGECCINGKDYRDALRILMSTGEKGTLLNEGTWDILNRVRNQYGGLDGVKHWVIFNKNLEFYIYDFSGIREQLRKEILEN